MKQNRIKIIKRLGIGCLIVVIGVGLYFGYRFQQPLLDRHQLGNESVERVVEKLEQADSASFGLIASVRPNEVQMHDQYGQVNLSLDRFYLTLAPYTMLTHECFNHSLTTCQGEMANQMIHLVIKNEKDEVVVDEDRVLNSNGFTGTWLDKNATYQVEITSGNLRATQSVTTYSDSPTCITTMKLK